MAFPAALRRNLVEAPRTSRIRRTRIEWRVPVAGRTPLLHCLVRRLRRMRMYRRRDGPRDRRSARSCHCDARRPWFRRLGSVPVRRCCRFVHLGGRFSRWRADVVSRALRRAKGLVTRHGSTRTQVSTSCAHLRRSSWRWPRGRSINGTARQYRADFRLVTPVVSGPTASSSAAI